MEFGFIRRGRNFSPQRNRRSSPLSRRSNRGRSPPSSPGPGRSARTRSPGTSPVPGRTPGHRRSRSPRAGKYKELIVYGLYPAKVEAVKISVGRYNCSPSRSVVLS